MNKTLDTRVECGFHQIRRPHHAGTQELDPLAGGSRMTSGHRGVNGYLRAEAIHDAAYAGFVADIGHRYFAPGKDVPQAPRVAGRANQRTDVVSSLNCSPGDVCTHKPSAPSNQYPRSY